MPRWANAGCLPLFGLRAARPSAARKVLWLPRQIAPEPRGLLIRIAVLALQQFRLRIFDAPKPRSEIPTFLRRCGRPLRACKACASGRCTPYKAAKPRSCRSSPARTWAGAPNNKCRRRWVGWALGSKIQAHHPAQLREGPAHRASPQQQLQILAFHVGLTGQPYHGGEGGAAARQLQVAQCALPEPLPLGRILIKIKEARVLSQAQLQERFQSCLKTSAQVRARRAVP